jgi:hypothetical protein
MAGAVSVIVHNETFQDYYRKKQQAVIPYVSKAAMAAMHKLIRMFFDMLSHRERYEVSVVNCI